MQAFDLKIKNIIVHLPEAFQIYGAMTFMHQELIAEWVVISPVLQINPRREIVPCLNENMYTFRKNIMSILVMKLIIGGHFLLR